MAQRKHFRFLDEFHHHDFSPITNALLYDESLREGLKKIHIMSRPDSPERVLLTSPLECQSTLKEVITKEFVSSIYSEKHVTNKCSIRQAVSEALGVVGYEARDVEKVIGILPPNCSSIEEFESALNGNCLARKFAFPDVESMIVLLNDSSLTVNQKTISFPVSGEYLLSLVKCSGDIFSERPLISFNSHVERFLYASTKPLSGGIITKLTKADVNGLNNIITRTRINAKNMLNSHENSNVQSSCTLEYYIKESNNHYPHRLVRMPSLQKIIKSTKCSRTPSLKELKDNSIGFHFAYNCYRCKPFLISKKTRENNTSMAETVGETGGFLGLANVERIRPHDSYDQLFNHFIKFHTRPADTVPRSLDTHPFILFCPICVGCVCHIPKVFLIEMSD